MEKTQCNQKEERYMTNSECSNPVSTQHFKPIMKEHDSAEPDGITINRDMNITSQEDAQVRNVISTNEKKQT